MPFTASLELVALGGCSVTNAISQAYRSGTESDNFIGKPLKPAGVNDFVPAQRERKCYKLRERVTGYGFELPYSADGIIRA
jgi:hypothetical protein